MTTNATIKLVTSNDWISWYKVLKTKANNEDLWSYIDPTKEGKPTLNVEAPMPPIPSPTARREGSPPQSTQGTQGTLATGGPVEGVTAPTPVDYVQQSQRFAELPDTDQKALALRWTMYEHLSKDYKEFRRRVATVQNWVIDTVDEPIARHHFTEDDTLDKWIKSLYTEFSLATTERKQTARRDYRALLNEPHRSRINTYKATGEWLSKWRTAINEASDVGLQEAKEADQWFPDLSAALRATPLESWVNAYGVTQVTKVRENTLKVAEVSADIRLAIADQPETKRPRVSHGAFPSAKGAEEGEDPAPKRQKRNNKSQERRGQGPSSSRPAPGDNKDKRCHACGMLHLLKHCWYAFPEKAPAAFKPVEDIEAHAQRRIANNEDKVADHIKRIKLQNSA
ncbi:hypothetical protein CDV31_016693 [Fusarium ambrosium]|uniref:Gag protein n=1 Tax=Fusarium ambrosium TaxID=131363 RepID=A0A428S3W1_9HYPO|nr:hypothetical protein CDV31_016693 [Fusarium ambrosium]